MTDKCNPCRWRVAYPTKLCALRISNKFAKCNFKPAFVAQKKEKERLISEKQA